MGDDVRAENPCVRLIEVLAHGDPVPDTSGICRDRIELLALLTEISKGERSEFLPHITQAAQRQGISPQQFASRASFLLACLETPGDEDAYKILGVPPTATPQEIRNAWVARLSLYHPDRHSANSDWFTRQAARLNEAYHTLKDPERRQAYDEQRRREVQGRRRQDLHRPPPWPSRPRMLGTFSGRMRQKLPTILTGGALVTAGLIVLSLILGRPTHRPEVTPISSADTPGPAEERPSSSESFSQEQERQPVRSLKPQPKREQGKKWPSRAVPARVGPHDVQEVLEASEHGSTVAQALPPYVPDPKGLNRQEIDALLDEYRDAYEKGDVERLMATLSQQVREKGTLDYQTIRSLYAKGFAGREQIIYRLKNVEVQMIGDHASVSAQYLISARNADQPHRSITTSGRIEWKVQREGAKPKIMAINY